MATWAERQKAPAKGEKDSKGNPVLQKDYPPDDTGLKLRVFASGRRVWFIRGRIKRTDGEGAPRFIVLGEVPGMSREDADAAAANARHALRQGIDPNMQREAALRAADASRKTFGEVVAEWTDRSKPKWRSATIEARRVLFNGEKLRPWHDRQIASITGREVAQHAATIKRNTQQSQLGPLRSVFKFAVEQGYITRSPFVEAGISVERSEGNAAPLIEFHEGRAPDFSELVAVLDAFDTCEKAMPVSPWWNIWRVCVLTGQRPSAVIGLCWSELSLDGDEPTWTLPAERSKIKREAKIPLSQDCAALLRAILRGESALVWPGRGGQKPLKYPEGEPKMVNGALAERYPRGWKPGRARDSVATWLEFQSDATERAMALLLGHTPPAENTRRKHYAKIGAEHQARVLIERYAQAVRDARAGKVARVVPLRKGA
jgi:integrase